MREQDYQSKIIKRVEARGGYVVKVISAGKKGVPDVLICYRGYFIAVEVKTPDKMKNTSPLQDYNIKLIQSAGGRALVACEFEQVKEILDDIDQQNTN